MTSHCLHKIPTELNLQKYFLLEVSFSCDPGAREAGAFPDVWESVYPCIIYVYLLNCHYQSSNESNLSFENNVIIIVPFHSF